MGIDPGTTTGWCLYVAGVVFECGQFTEHGFNDFEMRYPEMSKHLLRGVNVVIERPVPHGATYPQVVECAYITGRIVERLSRDFDVHELTRQEIRRRLQAATNGAIRVQNDASVWAALKALHGGEASAKKGGALYGVKAHGRAALAAAVAWGLPEAASRAG